MEKTVQILLACTVFFKLQKYFVRHFLSRLVIVQSYSFSYTYLCFFLFIQLSRFCECGCFSYVGRWVGCPTILQWGDNRVTRFPRDHGQQGSHTTPATGTWLDEGGLRTRFVVGASWGRRQLRLNRKTKCCVRN